MSLDVINLLPPEKKRAFRRGYFLRLATVAVLLIAALVIVHAVLLLPSSIYLSVVREARERELAAIAESAASETSATSIRLAKLKEDAVYLTRLGEAPAASAAVQSVLLVPRQGIRITSITFAPSTGNAADGVMTVSGIASTREALRSYNLALSNAPFVSKAELPISSYAAEADIQFTITLTGTLKP